MDFKEFKEKFEKIPVQIINDLPREKPLVSVCIQTYNQVSFIEKCIEGALIQKTNFPFEILLADDASNDGTRDICIRYASQYPDKIKLFLHYRENNIKIGGFASATFIALYNFFQSKGKYIAICEGDDFWTDPLKLQKQFDFMEGNNEYSVCYHDYKIVNSKGLYINSDKASPLRDDLKPEELILSFRHPATLTVFFRNNINKIIPEEITKVFALDVFLNSLLGQIGGGKYLDYVLPSSYRVHEGGVWSAMDIGPKLISKINTYSQLSKYYLSIGDNTIAKNFKQRNSKIKRYLVFLSVKNFEPKYLIWLIKNWKGSK